MLRRFVLSAVLITGFATVAFADSSPIVVKDAWARATPKGANAGATYFTVVNTGSTADRLTGASTPVAAEAQLHIMSNDNGVMKMRPVQGIDVKPGASVSLKPGGLHVMLTGLKQPLTEGETFPLTLTFEKAGTLETTVKVAKIGAATGMDMSHGSMNMGNMPAMGGK